ncbi:hypothetical protein Y032_0167g102 [Ancylostoma ceylanicum]|uniref:Clc-like protein n=1 Tax=Ancylostoma ceylanicum TaxID=53326 RepID=A0A016SWH5_9BILA|nr:hypothetical protein Y032_0167g102 [Ancylostoma ceylanicum]
MADGGVSKCGRKAALSTFFVVTFTAFTLSVISLISPSWQYVSLENGRTEHHHGLWLDCKRDYSFDYGRTREYYETLYRRDLQGSPFDIFFLPPLHCVYKFDYYIDPEDLYDHNHDENRIQNDAYQHLFLGWKIAALSGCGSALVFSASALLFAVYAFCHRTFICASTVLVTVAAILSTIGVTIFYAWANYQDNKVIKEEEDTIYEQMLGWAFYCQVVTTIIHWLASMLGCCVTSVSFSKTRAKLVKIEVVEGGDESQLLSSRNSSQPFKRSFSAIYRVDSQSLRQWERDYMRNAQERQERQEDEHTFKRTTSMPYYSKKQRAAAQKKLAGRSAHDFFSSTSNITETTHTGSMNILERNQPRSVSAQPVPPANPTSYPAAPKLKSALKTPQQSRKSVNISDSDITYEYLPCDDVSIGVSSFSGAGPSSSQRMYDPVYEQIGQEDYLEPNSVRQRSNLALNVDRTRRALPSTQPPHGSSQSIPVTQPKTTLIDDVARPSSFVDVQRDRFNQNAVISTSKRPAEETKKTEVYERIQEAQAKEKTVIKSTSFPANPHPESKPPLSIRDFGIDLTPKRGYCDVETTFGSQTSSQSSGKIKYADLDPGKSVSVPSAPSPLRYISVEKVSTKRLHELSGQPSTSKGDSSQLHRSPERPSATPRSNDSFDSIPLSNAGIAINTFGDREKQRSITNLTFRPQSTTGASEVFERPDSMSLERSSVILTAPTKPRPLQQLVHRKLLTTLPDEVDRSIGSSTLMENETMRDSADSYARDAEIRLNLFMNDNGKDETTV